jgi:hypothetical protein
MPLELTNLIRGFEQAETEIRRQLERESVKAANDLARLVTNRVVQRGEDEKGAPFTPYSTKKVGAFRFFGKSRSALGEQKVRTASKKGKLLSYKDFRELNNLNTDRKNFEFTGEMWRKVGINSTKTIGDVVTVTIGGTTTASALKLEENTKLEGKNILNPKKTELNTIAQNLEAWMNQVLTASLNV